MIDATTARMLNQIAARASDLLGAYKPGAEPQFTDVVRDERDTVAVADPLSVTSADGYFVVDDRGRRAFTKDGSFAFRDGVLVAQSGAAVYGYADSTAQKNGILTLMHIDPIDAALSRHQDLRVESDGAVAYTRTVRDTSGLTRPERIVLGKLALARFPAGTKPQVDGTHVVAPSGTKVHLGVPADGNFSPLATYTADKGGYDVDVALQRLHDAYQAFDAVQAAKSARGKTDRTAMDLIK